MNLPSGIGKLDRTRLSLILQKTQQTISAYEAAEILNMPKQQAAKLLARWAAKGWISRVKHGLYIPVPLESTTADVLLDDPWVIAEKIYHPCYVAGWSAVEHWGLTEQIFRTVIILTTKKLKDRHPVLKGIQFLLHTISKEAMFGLQTIWRDSVKVSISDPSRTLLDLLAYPSLGGGIRSTVDMLINYLNSEHKNLPLLVDYAKRLDNGAVFKRLGFLLERYAPNELETIKICENNLTQGKVKLDPQLVSNKLITQWRLWAPENWKNK